MIVHGVELNQNKPGVPLIVARDWGENEEQERRPLVEWAPAGELFTEVLSYGGWRRQDVNITNVVPEQRPPFDDFRRHNPQDVEAGRAALDKLVKRLKPSLIIAMGNEAAFHFVPDWPTGGRGIFNAKGIEDRRGYFWETPSGWVYTVLHPAGAARKIVPGYELLRRDFKRAKQWVRGKLPREEFPDIKTLSSPTQVQHLLRSKVIAADIETRFGQQVFTCAFTGDDLQPYVAKFGRGFDFMRELLKGRKGLRGVFHNGQFDADILDRDGYPTSLFTDDTQTMWGNGLEPELAFHDEDDKGRLTRKGLASLASLCPGMNIPFWKAFWTRLGHPEWNAGYPQEESDDPRELSKLYVMGGRDSYVTRRLFNWLWPEILKHNREMQYRLAFETNLRCITMTRRGWRVDEELRQSRMETLQARAQEAKVLSATAALKYIEEHQIEEFKVTKQCTCCNGAGEKCWRCAGLKENPKKKEGYLGATLDWARDKHANGTVVCTEEHLETLTVAELKALLPPCQTCEGRGKNSHYEFNPYSRDQLVELLYNYIGAPKHVFKGKDKMDEMAHIRLLFWSGKGNLKDEPKA